MTRPFAGRSGRFLTLIVRSCFWRCVSSRDPRSPTPSAAASSIRRIGRSPRADVLIAARPDRRRRRPRPPPTAASARRRSRPVDYDVIVVGAGSARDAAQTIAVGAGFVARSRRSRWRSRRVSESVVVSAAQVDSPLSRATDSVTVIDARRSRRAPDQTRSPTALRLVPGLRRRAVRRPRRGDVDLPARRRVRLHARAGRRHSAERVRRRLRRRASAAPPTSIASRSCADRRARSTAAARSAASCTSSRAGRTRARARAASRAAATARCERGASASGIVRRLAVGRGDRRLVDRRRHALSRQPRHARSRTTTTSASTGIGQRRLVGSSGPPRPRRRARRPRRARQSPGPYGSDPLGLYGGLDTISRGTNTLGDVGASALFGISRRACVITRTCSSRTGRTSSPSQSFTIRPFGDPTIETRRVDGPVPGRSRPPRARPLGRRRSHPRARRQHVRHRAGRSQPSAGRPRRSPASSSRRVRRLGQRAFVTAGAARRAHRARRARRRRLSFGARRPSTPTSSGRPIRRSPRRGSFARRRTRPDAARAGRRSAAAPAPASSRRRRSRSRSRTIRLSSRSAAGASTSASSRRFAGAALVADATCFANRYDDLIVAVSAPRSPGASRYRTDNIANARAHGLEFGVALARVHGGLAARGAWTWLDTEILGVDGLPDAAPAPYTVGDPLVRRPRQQGSLDVTLDAPARAVVFCTINGRGDDDATSSRTSARRRSPTPATPSTSIGGVVHDSRRCSRSTRA